ncbi:MAG: CotH kinase family protein [Planctomycetes bacterium]|nr:CotH kinase family protein [Planctomycetota bacterium]
MSGPVRASSFLLSLAAAAAAQIPQGPPDGGFGGPGMGPGMGPGPGPMNESVKVLEQFDADKSGRLDVAERLAAREWLKTNRPQRGMRGPGGRGPGGPGGPGGGDEGARTDNTPKVGGKVAPKDVPNHHDKPLFAPDIVRTFFLEFPNADWHEELTAFYRTDVDVPAKVTVDGKLYPDVGVQFRGNTSFGMAPGKKKSIDLAFDFADPKQNLLGVRNLDLLNCNTDASSLREVLHGHVANEYMPAPRVVPVRVVVNGEDYGVYAAVEQFDKEFVQAHFGTKQGDRFKVPPDFSGNGGLRFLGDDPAAYRRNYQLKSNENDAAWQGLVDACGALESATADRLEAILPQHLDVDGMLWFLALDNALGDDDGYFSRASDYLLYRDPKGRFHAIPRDNNEILLGRGAGGPPGRGPGGQAPGGQGPGGERRPEGDGPGAGGPPMAGPGGGRRGPGGGGTAATPLAGANRADRPLLKRLLEVPAWRERYLANLRELATVALAEEVIGERLDTWRKLLEPLVAVDAHSLYGLAAFQNQFAVDDQGKPAARSLPAILAQRRKAILDDAAMQGAWPVLATPKVTVQTKDDRSFVLSLVATTEGAPVGTVRVHFDRGAFGVYTTAEMFDDGQHGDGKAGDGTFGFSLPEIEAGSQWRWWLEAVAKDSGHVDCQPAANGALPFVWQAPNGKTKAK